MDTDELVFDARLLTGFMGSTGIWYPPGLVVEMHQCWDGLYFYNACEWVGPVYDNDWTLVVSDIPATLRV